MKRFILLTSTIVVLMACTAMADPFMVWPVQEQADWWGYHVDNQIWANWFAVTIPWGTEAAMSGIYPIDQDFLFRVDPATSGLADPASIYGNDWWNHRNAAGVRVCGLGEFFDAGSQASDRYYAFRLSLTGTCDTWQVFYDEPRDLTLVPSTVTGEHVVFEGTVLAYWNRDGYFYGVLSETDGVYDGYFTPTVNDGTPTLVNAGFHAGCGAPLLGVGGLVYEARFTSAAPVGTAGFAPPTGYGLIYNGGALSGGLDEVTNFGLRSAPDYTGWNANHTGEGCYDDPVRGWSFNNNDNNGGYTDAYSETEATDSGHVEFEWTFKHVTPSFPGYLLTVTADDLDDYVAKKGPAWAGVPDEWKVYVNGNCVGTLYDFDDPQGTGPDRSINTFDIGNVSGSVKIEINGTYFDLLHDPNYYGGPTQYGDFASWGDTASAQHGIRLEGLRLQQIPVPKVITEPATDVGMTSATLNARIEDDGGEACQWRFDWWSSDFFASCGMGGALITGQSFQLEIDGLKPGTLHYFRAHVKNSTAEAKGNIQSFVTLPGCGTVLLLTPNGGEQLVAGYAYDITWQSVGNVQNVILEYSVNSGTNWTAIATVSNTGSYQWLVPQANSQQCVVRISNAVCTNINDTSDAVFTIYQSTLSCDVNHDGVVDALDFAIFASQWLKCGNPFDPNCQ